MPDIILDLKALLGEENVFSSATDRYAAACLSFSNELNSTLPLAVLTPAYPSQIGKIIKFCIQHSLSLRIRGGNTFYLNEPLPELSLVLDTGKLNKILKIDPITREISLQAGVKIKNLQKAASDSSLSAPYLFPEPASTIGGAVASNYWNAGSLKFGSIASNVNSIKIWNGNGETEIFYNSNGSYANPHSSFPLTALFCGSNGMLGVIEELTVRLMPLTNGKKEIAATFKNGETMARACEKILVAGLTPDYIFTFNQAALEFADIKIPEPWLLLLKFQSQLWAMQEEEKLYKTLLETTGAELLSESPVHAADILSKVPVKIAVKYPIFKRNMIGCPAASLPALFESIQQLEKQYDIASAIFGSLIGGQLQVICFGNSEEKCAQFSHDIFILFLTLNNLLKSDENIPASAKEWQKINSSPLANKLKSFFDPYGLFSSYKKQGA